MYKLRKRIFSIVLATAMTFSVVPYSSNVGFVETVDAATNPEGPADGYPVSDEHIKDAELLKALRKLIGGSETANIFFKDLRAYDKEIDLSAYPDIRDVSGLGYAINAKSIDISKLSKVTIIYEDEFKDCKFSEFKMAPNVTEIRSGAFNGCKQLKTIDFPAGLVEIHESAFKSCEQLNDIAFPAKIVYIGGEAFKDCISLEKIAIPDGLNASTESATEESEIGIGANVFNGCIGLKTVKLASDMTAIPTGFLLGTKSLSTITIPESVTNIRSAAFRESGLESIDISKNTGISVINKQVFYGCSNLKNIKLPNTITDIEEAAFFSCLSIVDTGFLSGLENLVTIGRQAFAGIGAATVTVPTNVEKIDYRAFAQCSNLESVSVRDFDLDKIVGTKIKLIGRYAFTECGSLETVYLPRDNENSSKVTIEIDEYAFYKCIRLQDIYFPLNLTKIGDYAFKDCSNSTTDWANRKIGKYTGRQWYTNADNIRKTNPGGNFTSEILWTEDIEAYYQPTSAYIDMTQCVDKKDDINNIKVIVYDPTGQYTTKMHIQEVTGLKTVDLSKNERVTLGIGVFENCKNLEKASLPNNMTEIPEATFQNCATPKIGGSGGDVKGYESATYADWYIGLEEVEMSNRVTSIGKNVFAGCYRLDLNGELPNRLVEIKEKAFYDCESIGEITLPGTLKYIGNAAFQNCSRVVDSFVISGLGLTECNAKNADKLQFVGSNAFANCPFTEFSMNAAAPVTSIQNGAFNNCQYMTKIEFSDSVNTIAANALGKCLSLQSIKAPGTCTIDKNVFNGRIKVGTVDYFTSCFANGITLSVNNSKNVNVSIRENSSKILPLYTLDKNGNARYDEVIIGGNVYEWLPDEGVFYGPDTDVNITPELINSSHMVGETDYQKEVKEEMLAISLNGLKAGSGIPITVSGILDYIVFDNTKITLPVEVRYTAEVTDNPCTEIKAQDVYCMSYKANSTLDITPEFVAQYDDGEITDEIVWIIESGADLISLTESADGKSATVKAKGNTFGTARITVKAGAIMKSFYVYTKTPATSFNVTPSTKKVDMMIGNEGEISVSLNYIATDKEVALENPDKVTYTSNDESVVKVKQVIEEDGITKCILEAVGIGNTTITIAAEAGKITLDCAVVVSSENIATDMKDSEGNVLSGGTTVDLVGKSKVVYNYDFTDSANSELDLNQLSYTVDNEDIVKVSVDAKNKKVTIEATAKGKTKVTLYPSVGNTTNGIELYFNVNANITNISLTKKTVELGKTDNVLSKLRNTFNQDWLAGSGDDFSIITDNDIVFESSDPSCVTVDGKGNVTVISLPEVIKPVTITCSAMREGVLVKQTSTTVTPAKPSASDITTSASTSLEVGQVIEIPFTIVPEKGAYQSVSISSVNGSDKNYFRYEWNRNALVLKVTGVAAGSAELKVTVKISATYSFEKIIAITVTDKSGTAGQNVKAPKKVKISKVKAGKKKATVQWKEVNGASGYQVQMSTKKKKGFKNIKKSTKKLKFVKKKLKSKKTYYFRVRAFVKGANGKKVYGKWSKVKKVKVK